mgnify:CR=1 FL=1
MGRSGRRLSKLLANGASTTLAVNGSSTPVTFTLAPGNQVGYEVRALVLTFHSTAMDLGAAADMRVLGAAGLLTNGIRVYESRGTPAVEVDIFPTPVKATVQFFRYATWSGAGVQVSGHTDGVAAGTDALSVTISWPIEDPLTLRSRSADTLTVRIADNLTGLALFEAHAVGRQFFVT